MKRSRTSAPGAGLLWRLSLALLRRLPQGALSRATGRFAELRLPRPLRGPVLRGFARVAGIDVTEAERPLETYPSVAALFTRRLRAGVRSWPTDPVLPASPVDGIVGQAGRVSGGKAIQAKGLRYSVRELLASPHEGEGTGVRFEGGAFVTLYLAPRHYHRIHAPVSGEIQTARAVPGALLPVNPAAVARVPHLFPRNERLVVPLRAAQGELAVVAVGAFNVGGISAAFDPAWNGPDGRGVTNRARRKAMEERRYEPALCTSRGEELMAFHLGSTVVLLFDGGWARAGLRLRPDLAPGREIRLGEPLLEWTD